MFTIFQCFQVLTNSRNLCSVIWSGNTQERSLSCFSLRGTEAPCLFSSGCKITTVNTVCCLSSEVGSAEGEVPGYIVTRTSIVKVLVRPDSDGKHVVQHIDDAW